MFPCPKCNSSATHPSSDKDLRDPLFRVFLLHAMRCHVCNHRFRVFTRPAEWKQMRDAMRTRSVERPSAS